jgi:hypothetical protein
VNKLDAIREYNCPGCVHGPEAPACSRYAPDDKGCRAHHPGTMGLGIGAFALGLPKGFCRFGKQPTDRIEIHESWTAMVEAQPNLRTVFCVPVWKHLDRHGNTVIRWYSPRTNAGWSVVVLGDCRDMMPNALDITQEHLNNMD